MNEQEEFKNAILERFENLQPEIQAVIMDPNYDKTVYDIAQKYSLSVQQTEALELNTTFVLLGQTHPDQYASELAGDLKSPQDTTLKVISDINTKILTPKIREMIKKNFEEDDKEEAEMAMVPLPVSEPAPVPMKDLDPRFSSLPKNLQEAIARSDYQKKIYTIGSKYKLQVPQMASLEEITVQLLTGEISSKEYEGDLALATELPSIKVRDIAKDVNEEILAGIRAAEMKKPKDAGTPEQDLDIPLPPYTPKPSEPMQQVAKIDFPLTKRELSEAKAPASAMSKSDKGILADAGIEMIDSYRIPASEIKDIIGEKLSMPTKSKMTVSNQTLPKITAELEPLSKAPPAPPLQRIGDPYHESV